MKIKCEIIRDILPLYAEDIVSQPTRDMVEEHLAECENCTVELEELKQHTLPMEPETASLNRVKQAIRRRQVLSVMAVLLFIATVLSSGALMLDAYVYLSPEEAVEEIWVEGNTVKIRWNNRINGTGYQYDPEKPGNYGVVAWTNLQKILMPTQRVPYEALDEEVKSFLTEEEYAAMDNTSSYQVTGEEGTNFWYCDLAKGQEVLILEGGQPHPDGKLIKDGLRIRYYVYGLVLLCVLAIAVGIFFRGRWYGLLAMRVGILAGSGALSAVIVTAGQLVDIYGRFTEMLVDSTVVALPMVLCSLCIMQLIRLNRQDKGL